MFVTSKRRLAKFGVATVTALVMTSGAVNAATASAEPPEGSWILSKADHIAQKNNSYCGPAVASMMIKTLKEYGKISSTRSKPEGWQRSQVNLAKPRYLDTHDDGTQRKDMKQTLNRWTGLSFYVVDSNPSPSQFRSHLKYDTQHNYPMAVSTREVGGDIHYNKHPANKTIAHWVMTRGYHHHGDTTAFMDPATSVWDDTQPYFDYPTAAFTVNFLQFTSNGAVVW